MRHIHLLMIFFDPICLDMGTYMNDLGPNSVDPTK